MHRRVREAAHVQRHDPRLVLPALIPEGGEQRLPRQRSQRRVRLADVHAAELVVARGVDVDRADAFDRRLARFALDAEHARERGVGLEGSRAVRLFEAEQDLMPAAGRIAELERHQRAADVVAVDRPAGDGGQLVARRQLHLQRSRLALHDREIDQRHHAQIRLADGDERADVRQHARVRDCGLLRGLPHRPGELRGSSGDERELDARAAVRGGAADDEARLDADVGRIAGQVDDRADRTGRRLRQREPGTAGCGLQRGGPVDRYREGRRPGEDRGVAVCLMQQRQRLSVGARLDQGGAANQRHLDRATLKDFAVELQRAAHGGPIHARAHVSAADDRRHRRRVDRGCRLGGAIEEPIVVGDRQRHASRRTLRAAAWCRRLRMNRRRGRRDAHHQRQQPTQHDVGHVSHGAPHQRCSRL